MNSLDTILALSEQPVSDVGWGAICAKLDACADESELVHLLNLAKQIVKDWPAGICVLPAQWANDPVRKQLAKVALVWDTAEHLAGLGVDFPRSFRIQSFDIDPDSGRALVGGSDSRFLYVFLFTPGSSDPYCLEKHKIQGRGAYAQRVEQVRFLPGRGDAMAVINAEGGAKPFNGRVKIWRGERPVRHIRDAVGVRTPNRWHSVMVLPDAVTSRLFVWLGGEKRLLIFHLATYKLLKSIALPPVFSISIAESGKLLERVLGFWIVILKRLHGYPTPIHI